MWLYMVFLSPELFVCCRVLLELWLQLESINEIACSASPKCNLAKYALRYMSDPVQTPSEEFIFRDNRKKEPSLSGSIVTVALASFARVRVAVCIALLAFWASKTNKTIL